MKRFPVGVGIVALVSLITLGLWANKRLNTLIDEIDWDNFGANDYLLTSIREFHIQD